MVLEKKGGCVTSLWLKVLPSVKEERLQVQVEHDVKIYNESSQYIQVALRKQSDH